MKINKHHLEVISNQKSLLSAYEKKRDEEEKPPLFLQFLAVLKDAMDPSFRLSSL